jgi:hypothetical protein
VLELSQCRDARGVTKLWSTPTGHFEIANLGSGAYDLDARAADGGDGELRGVAAGTTAVSIKIVVCGPPG